MGAGSRRSRRLHRSRRLKDRSQLADFFHSKCRAGKIRPQKVIWVTDIRPELGHNSLNVRVIERGGKSKWMRFSGVVVGPRTRKAGGSRTPAQHSSRHGDSRDFGDCENLERRQNGLRRPAVRQMADGVGPIGNGFKWICRKFVRRPWSCRLSGSTCTRRWRS